MSVIVSHSLTLNNNSGDSLKDMLINDGVVSKGQLYNSHLKELVEKDYVFDFAAIDKDYADDLLLKSDSSDKEWAINITHVEVSFSDDDNTMIWLKRYREDQSPAFLTSKLYKDAEFDFSVRYETDLVLNATIKNGEIINDNMSTLEKESKKANKNDIER